MASNKDQDSRVKRNQNRSEPPKHHWFRNIFLALITLVVLGALGGVGLFFYYAQKSPTITESSLRSQNSTRIYDANGDLIANLGNDTRQYVNAADIPDSLKSAVVSIEDKRFYKHNGVDVYRLLGATLGNIRGSSLGLQGGSTLTMQLVKLSAFSTNASDRNLRVKAQEAWMALNVEKHFTKQQILEFYINKVYMGNGIFGMGTASKYYYGKSLKNISVAQAALLAGMPQSPTYYNPYNYPKYAKQRRDIVLTAMYDNHQITKQQETDGQNSSVTAGLADSHADVVTSASKHKVIDSYLKEVISDLKAKGYNPYTDGLKVYTNLNMDAQQHLYQIANTEKYVSYPSNKFQLGATMVDSYTGKVSAMIGGRKTGNVSYGLNRAVQKTRSNGSTMKPILDFGPAIEYLNWPTYKKIADTKYKYKNTNIELHDFDNKTLGNITMRKALVESRNIAAVRTLDAVGENKAKTFANNLGMDLKTVVPSNGIGAEVSSLQVASAYSAFADGGVYHKPYYINKIVTQDNQVKKYGSDGQRAMKESTAYMITDMLKGVIASPDGSGTAAQISGLYQAGKTGTVGYPSDWKGKVPDDADSDAWMAGYTKNYSIAVWTGYDQAFTGTKSYLTPADAKISQNIYRELMSYVQQNAPNSNWAKPDTVGTVKKNNIQELYVVGHLFSNNQAKAASSSLNSAAPATAGNSSQPQAKTNNSAKPATENTKSSASSSSSESKASSSSKPAASSSSSSASSASNSAASSKPAANSSQRSSSQPQNQNR